jgi:hypothetical protein
VEWWNGGIVEWWNDGSINDPVPFLLITGPIGHAQVGSVQAASFVCKQCTPWIGKVYYHHETMPVHVLCIANGSLFIGITTTAQQWSHQLINHTLKLMTATETFID